MTDRLRYVVGAVLFSSFASAMPTPDCLRVPRFCASETDLRALAAQRSQVFDLLVAEDYSLAIDVQVRLLEADRLLLGDADMDVTLDRALLGCALNLADRSVDADAQFRCVLGLERCDAAPRADILGTVVDLEASLMAIPEFNDSILFEHLLRVAEASVGPDSVLVAGVLPRLSLLAASEGNVAEAEAMARRAIRILEERGGPNDGRLADVLNKLAVYASMNCDLKQAHAAFLRAANVALAAGPPFAYDAPRYLENDANSFAEDGDRGFAAELNRLAAVVRSELYGLVR